MFDPNPIIKQLEVNNELFHYIFSPIEIDESNWKPSLDKWSILEVVVHLVYEEKEDFRSRVEYALNNYSGEIPAIDPEGYINNIDITKSHLKDVLKTLYDLRKNNISFLKEIISSQPNWENTLSHPHLGELSAKMFLTNWLVHDNLHIKQVLTLRNQYLAFKTAEDIRYAGGV